MNELKERYESELAQIVNEITEDPKVTQDIVDGFKMKLALTRDAIKITIQCDAFTYEYLCRNLDKLFSEASYAKNKACFTKFIFD